MTAFLYLRFPRVPILRLPVLLALVALSTAPQNVPADITAQEYELVSADGTALVVQRFAASGDYLVLWLTSGQGAAQRSTQTAERLAEAGIEVWQIDLAEALFVPNSAEQMRAINADYVAELLQFAHRDTAKKILALAGGYSAIPLLRGIHRWQTRAPETPYLIGALLLSPSLYATIPSLGLEPEYVPVTKATNIPLMIFQDGKRGNHSQVQQLLKTLKLGGSDPIVKILPGVAGLLFVGDTAPETLQAVAALPDDINAAISVLEKMTMPLTGVPLPHTYRPRGSGIDDRLKVFKGKFAPRAIDLPQLPGTQYRRADYRGQITVVNFWASWCPPCVEEIPSLNQLNEQMKGLPFELISINYAEPAQSVTEFMRQVDVNFPVLLDTNGEFASTWNVVAFPSTYVVGPDGKIRYGVNAAIHWDNPEVISKLKALLQKPPGN